MTSRNTFVRVIIMPAVTLASQLVQVGLLAPSPAIAQGAGVERGLATLHDDLALTEARLDAV